MKLAATQRKCSAILAIVALLPNCGVSQEVRPRLKVLSRVISSNEPPFYGALYAERDGSRLLNHSQISSDNGRTWESFAAKPDYTAGLPFGYRRDWISSGFDSRTERLLAILNALDTPGLDPKAHEPHIALQTYYLRYRVSADGGRTWLFDEPIVERGSFDAKHPVEGVWVGTNGIFLGDVGCRPLFTRSGKILVPAQATVAGPDGKLYNPAGALTYTEALVMIGTWSKDGRIAWSISDRVRGDPTRTTRGLIEPTLAQFGDGRILMVMRGSNGGKADSKFKIPSHKWFSISTDDGHSWTKPEPWVYDDGTPFFSPSSMSALLSDSKGRCLWAGNLSPTNCAGNLPRLPLVIGEVDPKTLRLIRNSVLTVDTRQPADDSQGRLDICHMTMFEDRQNGDIVLSYPRAHNSYRSREWVTIRLGWIR